LYRAETPSQLYRIAESCEPAERFTDTGLPKTAVPAPDSNFDHANFYWRLELQPEIAATTHSASTIGNDTLQMIVNGHRGATVRITRGRGAGQERPVASNTAAALTIAGTWDLEPDATSWFAVSESGWKFGAVSKTSPVEFTIPNRAGEVVQILGRAANVNDVECAAELSTLTRWQISGTGMDAEAPPTPFFGLTAGRRGGTVELSGVSFADLSNTRSISSATLTLYYRDELLDAVGTLTTGMDNETAELESGATLAVGDLVVVGGEAVRVEAISGSGYRVSRALYGTVAGEHATGTRIDRLLQRSTVAAFPAEFFGSPYSGTWSLPIALPDARVVSGELFVTNRMGNSAARQARFTANDDHGLRTYSGGQYSIQVAGFLAIDESAAPPLVIEASHAMREIYGVLGTAADAPVTLEARVNGATLCALRFSAGTTISEAVSGSDLPPLRAGDRLTLAVTAVGQAAPGADLTVLIRL
jgi:hypothetical protein